MVSTPLKNISQNGNLPQIGMKIKNIWNHYPALKLHAEMVELISEKVPWMKIYESDYQNCILNHHELKMALPTKIYLQLPVFLHVFTWKKQLLGFFLVLFQNKNLRLRFLSVSPRASQSHQTYQQLPDRRTKCPGLGRTKFLLKMDGWFRWNVLLGFCPFFRGKMLVSGRVLKHCYFITGDNCGRWPTISTGDPPD